MAALPFPAILVPSQEAWNPRGGSRTGGQGIEGDEMIVASPTQRWRASASYPCKTRDAVLAMRTVISYGRAQTWLVGPQECVYRPRATGPLSFAVAGGAVANATTLTLARGGSAPRPGLLPGMTFSIGNRLHRIVALPNGDAGSSEIVVTIRPWLRATYPPGTPVEFTKPVGIMRLASDDTGEMMLALSRFADVSIEWIEAP